MISRSAEVQIKNWSDKEKAILTTHIVNQHRAGEEHPFVNSYILEKVTLNVPLPYSERIKRYFMWLAQQIHIIGEYIIFKNINKEYNNEILCLTAWTECIDIQETIELTGLLFQQGFFEGSPVQFRLTLKGYERLEKVERRLIPSIQAFVAMWFDPSMTDAYDQGIEPAVRETGYEPLRIDRKEHTNKIDDEIVAEIKRSKFLIADFTCGVVPHDGKDTAIARGGVYYEAGFAQGRDIPVIWCCRSDRIGDVHFDTRQFAHIVWDDPADLRKRLRDRIIAVIGERKLPSS